jgi:hypothetical protein
MKSRHMKYIRWRICDFAIVLGALENTPESNVLLGFWGVSLEDTAMRAREGDIRKSMLVGYTKPSC